jgi:hypothetical protein
VLACAERSNQWGDLVLSRFVIAALLGAVCASGCAGQTDFATGVGNSSATFHGRGTSGGSGTSVYFEYWKTSTPSAKQETPHRAIPANVTGSFKEGVTGLAQGTQYSYRLCGAEGGGPVCAQTRTLVPGRDNVQATGATAESSSTSLHWDRIAINSSSDPNGGNPSGRAFVRSLTGNTVIAESGSLSQDTVACVRVIPDPSSNARLAVVGFTGGPFPVFAWMKDAGPPGNGVDLFFALPVTGSEQVTDCSSTDILRAQSGEPLTQGDVAISDNQGSQPTAR